MEIVKEEGMEVMGGGEVESYGLEARQRRNLRCENGGGVEDHEEALEEKKKEEVELGEEGGRSVYFDQHQGLNSSSDQNVAKNSEFLDQKKSLQNEETEFEANEFNETTTVKTEMEEVVKAEHKSKFQVPEFDVERVLEEQETHDLFCPNCKSCITKRVILRKRKGLFKNPNMTSSIKKSMIQILIWMFLLFCLSMMIKSFDVPNASDISLLKMVASNFLAFPVEKDVEGKPPQKIEKDQNVAINSELLDQKSLQNEETEFEAGEFNGLADFSIKNQSQTLMKMSLDNGSNSHVFSETKPETTIVKTEIDEVKVHDVFHQLENLENAKLWRKYKRTCRFKESSGHDYLTSIEDHMATTNDRR